MLIWYLPGHETGNSFWKRSTVMKTVLRMPGLLVRLGTMAAFLLLGQQALAVGTDAGVSVDNRATVTYSVGGSPQTGIESSPTGNNLPGVAVPGGGADTSFVVDRRVDFTISQVGGALTQVAPGDNGVFVEFWVTNTSNSLLDFVISPTNLTSAFGDVRGAGTTDSDVDMDDLRIGVSAAPDGGVPGAGPDPVDPGIGSGATLINDLPEDDSIRVRIFAERPIRFRVSNSRNHQVRMIRPWSRTCSPTRAVLTVAVSRPRQVPMASASFRRRSSLRRRQLYSPIRSARANRCLVPLSSTRS
jgi:hypothetical protein